LTRDARTSAETLLRSGDVNLLEHPSFSAGLFEAAPDPILVADGDGRIVLANRRLLECFGYTIDEIVGTPVESLVPKRLLDAHRERRLGYHARPTTRRMGDTPRTLWGARKDGSEFPVDVSLSPFVSNEVTYVIAIVRDVSYRAKVEQRLRHMSTHDALTGLYNRGFFDEEVSRLDRGRERIGIVIADLDGLKVINDRFGHAKGDQLLQQAAAVLHRSFRAEDVVARLGGDEFGALVPRATDAELAKIVARVRTHARESPDEGGMPLSLSIGATTAEPGGLGEALRAADEAMYAEKRSRHESKMLSGDLAQVSLASVLSFLEAEKKTGEVVVLGMQTGRLRLRDGRPIAVSMDGRSDASPFDLVMDLLDWLRGQFEFQRGDDPDITGDLGMSVTALLLEHARRKDEARRASSPPPPNSTR
jgi:diguanylate cyclase (GGDEF)-like protein/PAS domain S-box-containing protein